MTSLVLVAAAAVAASPVRPLKYDLELDLAATVGGGAFWISTESVFKEGLAPPSCKWCDRTASGRDTLNPLDAWGRGARWSLAAQHTADMLSNVVDFGAVPIALLGIDAFLASRHDALGGVPIDYLVIIKTVIANACINQLVKFAVGRERPFVHALPDSEKRRTRQPADNNLSFYSGHTSFAFSMLVATARVAELRGYEKSWLIWAVGTPLAVWVPLLRMNADKHYLTDVLTGALVGSAIGYAIPTYFHSPDVDITASPTPGGVAFSGTF